MAEISFFVNSPQSKLNPDHLAQTLRQVTGVADVYIDSAAASATVSYESKKADTFSLVSAVHDAGYRVITESKRLVVTGMTCAGCAFHIESALTDVPGVVSVEVDLQTGITTVFVITGDVELKALLQAVEESGYKAYEPVPE